MGRLSKEIYERKEQWAEKRNRENAQNDLLTKEQHEVLAWLCKVRHEVHCLSSHFFISSSTNYNTFWGYINDEEGIGRIRSRLKSVDLPDIKWSFIPDDYISDNICYELGYSEEETREEEHNCMQMANMFNNDIENYLKNIDNSYETSYCPIGLSRIFI